MKDSLVYGVPGGLVSGFGYWVLGEEEAGAWHLLRVSLVMGVSLGVMFYETKKRNRAYFPYRYAWFSGFNTSFVFAAVGGLTAMVLASGSEMGLRALAYVSFMEFLNALFIGVLFTTGLAWIFKKTPNGTR